MIQTIGLILLGIGTAAAIWSAFNPSYFTIRKFGQREGSPEDRRDLKISIGVSIALILAVVAGMILVFKR